VHTLLLLSILLGVGGATICLVLKLALAQHRPRSRRADGAPE
jgi:hypothetical protein